MSYQDEQARIARENVGDPDPIEQAWEEWLTVVAADYPCECGHFPDQHDEDGGHPCLADGAFIRTICSCPSYKAMQS